MLDFVRYVAKYCNVRKERTLGPKAVGEELRARRQAANMTQRAVAEAAGLKSVSAVCEVERGKKGRDRLTESADAVARVFGLEICVDYELRPLPRRRRAR